MFTKNEGNLDRAFRIVVGVVLLYVFYAYPDASWRYWALVGVIPLVTGLVGTCPIYSMLGISSCPAKRS